MTTPIYGTPNLCQQEINNLQAIDSYIKKMTEIQTQLVSPSGSTTVAKARLQLLVGLINVKLAGLRTIK